jgi:SNF2 family DNA or RNA helicase
MNDTIETLDIATAFAWGPGKEVATKRGPRIVRKAPATPETVELFKAHNRECYTVGVCYGLKWKSQTEYEFVWWQELPKGIVQERQQSVEASRATNANVEIPKPDGLDYLPFQKAGIAFAKESAGCLIADEMGLGKTVEAIGVINSDEAIKKVLVICPRNLKLNWQREMQKWIVRPMTIGLADTKNWPSTDIVIIHYDALGKHKAGPLNGPWDLLIVDEAHWCKNRKAQRTQHIVGYKHGKKETEFDAIPPITAKRRLFLTGTPICNRPIELWTLVNYLRPDVFDNWWRFARRFCGMVEGKWGIDVGGSSNLPELQELLRGRRVMVRRMKADVLKELPPKRRQVVVLESDDYGDVLRAERDTLARHEELIVRLEAKAEIAKADKDALVYAAAVAELQTAAKVSFEQIALVRHETALAKLPAVKEFITELMESKSKLVLFGHHRDVIDQLFSAFKELNPVRVYGGMKPEEVQAAVDRFQKDEDCHMFIGGIMAAGVGITLTAASDVVFAELDWVPGNLSQCEDRCHRIGQTDSVNVYHLVLDGSIDQRMAHELVSKQSVIDRALDRMVTVEKTSPITPFTGQKVKVTRDDIDRLAAEMTQDRIEAIHSGLRMLAGKCDGASHRDDSGFSKVDVAIGHSLAEQMILTDRQAVIGARLCNKYRRQLPESLVAIACPKKEENSCQCSSDMVT